MITTPPRGTDPRTRTGVAPRRGRGSAPSTRTRLEVARSGASSKRRLRYRANSRSGAAIIEFAIVANVLFLMIFLCLEFARINMVRNLAQDAAYFAARVAVVPGATAAEAEAIAHTLMSTMVDSGYTVVAAEINDDTTEAVVTVSVDVDHVAFFGSKFLPNTEIVATARMRTERFTGFFKPST